MAFKRTGIVTVDIHICDEDDFAPSWVTENDNDQRNDNSNMVQKNFVFLNNVDGLKSTRNSVDMDVGCRIS